MSPQIIGYFSEKQDFARLGLIVGGCICTVAALSVRGLLDYWTAE